MTKHDIVQLTIAQTYAASYNKFLQKIDKYILFVYRKMLVVVPSSNFKQRLVAAQWIAIL